MWVDNSAVYYRRKRIANALLNALTIGIVALCVWVLAWVAGGGLTSGFTCEARPITVQNGDTLDGIVREFCAGVVTDALDEVVRAYGTTIYPNQVIYLPTSDECSLTITDTGQVYETC